MFVQESKDMSEFMEYHKLFPKLWRYSPIRFIIITGSPEKDVRALRVNLVSSFVPPPNARHTICYTPRPVDTDEENRFRVLLLVEKVEVDVGVTRPFPSEGLDSFLTMRGTIERFYKGRIDNL